MKSDREAKPLTSLALSISSRSSLFTKNCIGVFLSIEILSSMVHEISRVILGLIIALT